MPEISRVIPPHTAACTCPWHSQRTFSKPPKANDTTVVITKSTSQPTETGPIEQLLRIVEADASADNRRDGPLGT